MHEIAAIFEFGVVAIRFFFAFRFGFAVAKPVASNEWDFVWAGFAFRSLGTNPEDFYTPGFTSENPGTLALGWLLPRVVHHLKLKTYFTINARICKGPVVLERHWAESSGTSRRFCT